MIILISNPESVEGEIALINRLFQAGLQQFHLRKPNYNLYEIDIFLKQIDKKFHHKIVIHQHYELIKKYNLKGIHFTYKTKSEINKNEYQNLYKSVSIHSFDELLTYKTKQINQVFLSPIFDSISKPGYKSSIKLQNIADFKQKNNIKFNIIALGGIKKENISTIKKYQFDGIALLGTIWNDFKTNQNKLQIIEKFKQLKMS